MADPATNTAYPNAIEPLPEIGIGTRENDPGVEHDVVHDKAHATLNQLQAVVGTTEETDPESVLGRIAALALPKQGGVLIQCGSCISGAPVIAEGMEIRAIATAPYLLSGEWKGWCHPESASVEVDVLVAAFDELPPGDGDSICAGDPPLIEDASSAGAFAGPAAIARSDAVIAKVTASSGATWFALMLEGARP